jgi:hypothetical protein
VDSDTAVIKDTGVATTPSLKSVSKIIDKIAISELSPERCCEDAGITLPLVYSTLGELLVATTTTRNRYGESTHPDNRTRMAAVQLVLELRKHIKDKNVVTQVGIFNDPRVVAEAERVLGLRDI